MSEPREPSAGERKPEPTGEVQFCGGCHAVIGPIVIYLGRKMVNLGTVYGEWCPKMHCVNCLKQIHYAAADAHFENATCK